MALRAIARHRSVRYDRTCDVALGTQIVDELANRPAGKCQIEQPMDRNSAGWQLVANPHAG